MWMFKHQLPSVTSLSQLPSWCPSYNVLISCLQPKTLRLWTLTASCDAENHVITFILVHSPYGAVPAGVVITAGQSEQDYAGGFSALDRLLDGRGFHGNGHPNVIITDDSAAERSTLSVKRQQSILFEREWVSEWVSEWVVA